MISVPRLVIAAPSSGSGKTTVATGLMAAFAGRGLAVSPHKVGPDYIDPGYHALATGRPGRNLDPYLCGTEQIAPLFLHGAAGCELAVVEGVMGLFDGASGEGELASTAQVAKLLRAPVVLVVDASSQARSVAALVHGFASWDPLVRLGGVVLNKVGSPRHEEVLRAALDEAGVPVLGALHRAGILHVPSRHLGLVPAAERAAQAREWVAAAAAGVREGCDLEALLALARTAPALDDAPWQPPRPPGEPGTRHRHARPVIAVAGGAAFTFGYAEQSELLTAAGAQVVPFDPLADESLPERTAAVVLGGGFPELHAAELSANARLRAEIAAFRGPVAAECAGLLYLGREVDGVPMCGVLDTTATMTDRLTLGYREAVALGDSPLAAAGTRLRGHEFHRTRVEPAAGPSPAWGFTRPERRTEGFAARNVHASYLHVHWAGEPSLARRFVEGASKDASKGASRDE
ncbi:cobyrinate a,c-diamide synthase [Streptomyces sp. NBC_01190]|uniref:cobyrinate a,c-diamide synthase n=1 Tax=Streptomyces sp. NBC_01190 TaxID=2903767 RepID=UPI00386F9D1B|nr:cobyrinate a,c-diamide synthase [Streptomyces sp. NBC_01190]